MRRLFAGLAILGLLGGCQAGVLPGSSAPSGSTALPETAGPTATAAAASVIGQWVTAGTLKTGRVDPRAAALGDGRVLVVGDDGCDPEASGAVGDTGEYNANMSAEVWSPATNA